MEQSNIVVSVICNTYNHEPYIRQCLDGFVMQKTDFSFEVLIHDDASTDKTADIIREYEAQYPDIIKPIYQAENQYSKKTGIMKTFQYPRVKGKYIALCEGDDYWIDPLKLQKQVDFMEANPKCSLCHTDFIIQNDIINESTEYIHPLYNDKFKIISDIINGNVYRIQTNTVLFRKCDYYNTINSDYFLYQSGYFLMGDTQLWIGLLGVGDIGCINIQSAVYRVINGSACRNLDIISKFRFDLSCSELRMYLMSKIKILPDVCCKIRKDYNRNLLRYKLFVPNFTPLFSLNILYSILFFLMRITGINFILKKHLINKYK